MVRDAAKRPLLTMRQIATLPFPAITSEIISQDMSVPQNPVRLVDERQFGQGDRRTGQMTKRSVTMRFMVIVKASKDTEAGVMPSTELLTAMGKFNEEMVKAGVMLAGEGLHPTSKGARIKYAGKAPSVSHGPFAVTSDLIAGFWLIQVKSRDEAIEWMKRAPFDGGDEIEIRQVFEAEDFGEALTPELREQEERLRAQVG
jgi:hypothetical protein